jgi:hypothetical protein
MKIRLVFTVLLSFLFLAEFTIVTKAFELPRRICMVSEMDFHSNKLMDDAFHGLC